MATQTDMIGDINNLSVDLPMHLMRKKLSDQQTREALEKEVFMLQKMLNQEVKMHEILQHVHHQEDGSAITIPSSFPPKTKELLAELAMVDAEISRLENQITELRRRLKNEQEITKKVRSRPLQLFDKSSMTNANNDHKIAFETKTLHFINKAIMGDYRLSKFNVTNDKQGNSSGSIFVKDNSKEKYFRNDTKIIQDKNPRKITNNMPIKQLSPFRDRRHPSPKFQPGDRNLNTSLDLPPKSLSSTVLPEDNSIQNWNPNKLSENILKCLNFIYIRLLRTSRAMELEKSGSVSRSSSMQYSSISSKSFRGDTILNSKTSLNLTVNKESRRRDPYGIFEMEECSARDIGPYKNLVIFTSTSMDPKCISSSSSISLIKKLRILMSNLEAVDLRVLNYQQKLAFWINMYNACIMHGYLQYGVPNTPEKLVALVNKVTLNIGGNSVNAQAIERYILRKSTSLKIEDHEATIRNLCGLDSHDVNVTFALSCGTRSSPAVRIFTSDGVIGELEKAKVEYLQASIVVTNTRKIAFPEILLRNMLDFAIDKESLLEWVCHQLPTSGSLRKLMVDCFRGHNNNSGKIISTTVEKIPYDFEFQFLLAI